MPKPLTSCWNKISVGNGARPVLIPGAGAIGWKFARTGAAGPRGGADRSCRKLDRAAAAQAGAGHTVPATNGGFPPFFGPRSRRVATSLSQRAGKGQGFERFAGLAQLIANQCHQLGGVDAVAQLDHAAPPPRADLAAPGGGGVPPFRSARVPHAGRARGGRDFGPSAALPVPSDHERNGAAAGQGAVTLNSAVGSGVRGRATRELLAAQQPVSSKSWRLGAGCGVSRSHGAFDPAGMAKLARSAG